MRKGGSESMGSTNPFKDQLPYSLPKKLFPWTLYALLAIVLVHFYFYPIPLSLPTSHDQPFQNNPITITTTAAASSSSNLPKEEETIKDRAEIACNYSNGKWVPNKSGPLYNGTTCGTIKDGQNCMSHGRPDLSYLFWRWRPNQCDLPRFEPETFLQILRNKHLAFVGDSMARNQLESLLCMLSTCSSPKLLYAKGDDNKFRRWHFPSHNVNVSIYWSPFLVIGVEKTEGANFNTLYLDSPSEDWGSDLDEMDMVVFSVGHWFLHSAVFFYGDSVLGCHFCEGQNYTEVGFYDVFGKAMRTTLKTIIERRGGSERGIDVIVTTFSPHHFEGEWDKLGACPKSRPYEEGEKEVEGMDLEMRKAEVEQVEAAKVEANDNGKFSRLRFHALDVTKLSLMRPDGHPGPYMYPNPFANGIAERVQNDCVHWCLPGPVDTWNEILLDVMKRWKKK